MATSVYPQGWPPPDYIDPQKRGGPALSILMCVITATVVVLRLYSRLYLTRSLGVDDGLLLAGFMLSIGQTFAEYKALTTWGWNMHLWDVPVDRVQYVRLSAWLTEFFFLLGNACTKISILLVYRKISSGSHSVWFIRFTWAAIAFTVTYTVGLSLELVFICRPFVSYWKSYSPGYTERYTCGGEQIPVVLSAAVSVFSDIYASVLPMLLVRNLTLTSRQRFGLYALFSAGLLTAAIGIGRMIFLVKVTTNYELGPHTHDVTWYGWPLYALTDIEAHLAMICASIPALKALFQRHISTKTSNTNRSGASNISNQPSSWPSQSQSSNTEHRINPTFHPTRVPSRVGTDARLHTSTSPEHHEVQSENFSLESMASNKPLTSSFRHIYELQKHDWRR